MAKDEAMEVLWKTCRQADCDNPAHVRYFWPGKDVSYACLICAVGVANLAAIIDLHLVFEPYQGEAPIRRTLSTQPTGTDGTTEREG